MATKCQDQEEETPKRRPVDAYLWSFCEALYALIGQIARVFVHNPDIRQEVVQHTAERILWRCRALYANDPDPEQHKGLIVTAVIRHHWRLEGKSRRLVPVGDEGPECFVDEEADPYRPLVIQLERRVLLSLRKLGDELLTDKQLEVFLLRMDGEPFKVIAEKTERSEVACRKSWMLAVRKLAKAAIERGIV
jgi:DNA-directed RNA polymerase specialized sigma24 family protein